MRTANKRYWLFQVCGWGEFVLIYLFFSWSFDKLQLAEDRRLFFSRIGLFVLVGILLTHVMRSVILRINLLQQKLERQIWLFVLITFVFATTQAALILVLHQYFNIPTREQVELLAIGKGVYLIANAAFTNFVYFFIWNGIYFMYHYIEKSQKQQLDTLQLETLVKELELKTIKAHINPHFIFNALNSIRALVDENPERARTAITELSTILRSSMQADKSESVAMEKELSIIQDYLALENMRFEDRLRIEYQIEEDTLLLPVPPMMLQTLVENAIKHGISKQMQGGVVRIVSGIHDSYHELIVQNTGHLNGYSRREYDDLYEKGFGLSSTTNRLTLLYGNKAKFEIRQVTPDMVEARVQIPLAD